MNDAARSTPATKNEALQFLGAVLPAVSDGVGLVSAVNYLKSDGDRGWRHRVFADISALYDDIVAQDGRAHTSVYFALASFPVAENGYGAWTSRKASNARDVRALWADIDCLSPAKQSATSAQAHDVMASGKYFNKRAAAEALNTFLEATGLPMPMIVDSGNGLHCYWTFSAPRVAADSEWSLASRRLGAVAAKVGLCIDPSRMGDTASVLRPVGATHFKADSSERRAVRVLAVGAGPQDADALYSMIAELASAHGVQLEARSTRSANPAVVAALNALPHTQRDAFMQAQTGSSDGHDRTAELEPIRRGCAQLNGYGDTGYENRLLAATIVSHCRGGREAYIQESLNCPTLRANGSVSDDADIIAKASDSFDRWYAEGVMPAYCEAWKTTPTAHKCEGCEYADRTNFTPISIGMGRAKKEIEAARAVAEAPAELVTTPAGVTLEKMPLPAGYRETNGQLEFMKLSNEGEQMWLPLLKAGTIRLVHVLEEGSASGPTSKYVFHRVMKYDKSRKGDFVEFTARQISRKQEMLDCLIDMQLSPEDDGAMHKYVRATVTPTGATLPVHTVLNHFGWLTKDDMDNRVGPSAPIRVDSPVPYDPEMPTRFVLHDRCYYPGGSARAFYTAQAESTATARGINAEGGLLGWQRAVDVIVRNKQHAGLFCLALSFGSALMQFAPAGTANPIVNFWAPDSGTGKSTMLRMANSVWAHPDRAMAQSDDSAAARSLYMPDFYSLPICIDEITNLRDEELSIFVFGVARGVERATATRERASRQARRWCAAILATANNTIAGKIAEFNKDRPGEQMRALDIRLPYPVSVRGREADSADIAALDNNYGVAGEAFIVALLADIPRMKAAIARVNKIATTGIGGFAPQDGERFWATAFATAIVAAELASEFGLVDFDIGGLVDFGAEAIATQRDLQKEVCGVDGAAVVDQFYAVNVNGAILRVRDSKPTHNMPDNEVAEGDYVHEPKPNRAVVGRYEIRESRLIVLGTAFDEHCRKMGQTPAAVLESLYKAGRLDTQHERLRTGGVKKLRYPLMNGSHMGRSESSKEPTRPQRQACYIITE